jgi:hypothetical protein
MLFPLTGMEGDAVCMQDVFRFKQTGVDQDGHAIGQFEACGVRPHCLERIMDEGIQFPPDMFRARVLVNPPPEVRDEPGVSVLRGGVLPLKSRTMRGVVLGGGYGGDARWIGEAARVVLPGLRVAGQGPDPAPEQIELMASAGGVWVGTTRR